MWVCAGYHRGARTAVRSKPSISCPRRRDESNVSAVATGFCSRQEGLSGFLGMRDSRFHSPDGCCEVDRGRRWFARDVEVNDGRARFLVKGCNHLPLLVVAVRSNRYRVRSECDSLHDEYVGDSVSRSVSVSPCQPVSVGPIWSAVCVQLVGQVRAYTGAHKRGCWASRAP